MQRTFLPFLSFFLISLVTVVNGQNKNPFRYQFETQAYGSTEQVPFWMRANAHGSVPLGGFSGSLIGQVRRDYDTTRRRLVDWGAGLEGRVNANAGGKADLLLIQGYAKVKLAMFEVRAGRWRSQSGLTDTLLTSGSFSLSGNALGIPQVQLAIPEFYPIPFTGDWLAIKGNFVHGWLGKMPIQSEKWVDEADTYYHQASLYGKIGRPGSKVRLYGGFNHGVFWGNERKIFGSTFTLSNWEAYQSVMFGKVWAQSKVGNHLGSLDVGIDFILNKTKWMLYRQFFYEVGALAYLGNTADGLTGISITRLGEPERSFRWKRFLIEFLYSKNQSGEVWSPSTPSGAEHYYNHSLYASGWSYEGRALGNPLFTPKHEAQPGQSGYASDYFINNRIIALHFATILAWNSWEFNGRLTLSRNYGTHFTNPDGRYRGGRGMINAPGAPFVPVNQCHMMLQGQRPLGTRTYVGGAVALDAGDLYTLNGALMVKWGWKL